MKNIGIIKLDYASFRLKEIFKETKINAKTTYTHSKNFTLQCGAQVQGGFKTFIQFIGSANKTTSNGEIVTDEKTSKKFDLDVLKKFQCRDLNVVKSFSLKYQFFNPPLTTKVLEDLKE